MAKFDKEAEAWLEEYESNNPFEEDADRIALKLIATEAYKAARNDAAKFYNEFTDKLHEQYE